MEKRVKRLGRATWLRDRFVALCAKEDGMIATRTFTPPGGTQSLEVNADASGGQLSAELCDAEGGVLNGFSKDECVPLNSDELRWQLKWKKGDFAKVKDAVKLRFILNGAKVYSFTFCH